MPAAEPNPDTPELPDEAAHAQFENNYQDKNQPGKEPLIIGREGADVAKIHTAQTTHLNSINNPQSLPTVEVEVENKPDVKEPSLPVIGFNLSSFVLFIISGFILFLVVFLFVKEFDASSSIQIPNEGNIPDSTYARKIELVRMIQEEKRSYRDFTVQMSQMVLLNLLLPVLTAILGYIFASNKNKE